MGATSMLDKAWTGAAQSWYHTSRRCRANLLICCVALLVLTGIWTYRTTDRGLSMVGSSMDSLSQPRCGPARPCSISRKIWQIMLPKISNSPSDIPDPGTLQDTPSWLAMNPDYKYTLLGEQGGKGFVEKHFADDRDVVEAYNNLTNVGMKSDLLRYLVLYVEGGVYTDTDTVALKPIDDWVPADIRDQVGLVVGSEFDRRDGGAWAEIPHWLQFCQWTIAAAPGHPVFRKMIDRVLQSLDYLSGIYQLPLSQLHPSSFDVMNSTGPAAWTDVVFAQLQEYDPSLKDTSDLSFMEQPKLYGDVLVLTIDGFGMGQLHSHSTNDGTIPEAALARHLFRGSWRDE